VTRRSSVRARLAAAGLDPDLARQQLADAGLFDDEELDADLLDLVSRTAEPDQALIAITDLARDHGDV
jgi:hypothetical protein